MTTDSSTMDNHGFSADEAFEDGIGEVAVVELEKEQVQDKPTGGVQDESGTASVDGHVRQGEDLPAGHVSLDEADEKAKLEKQVQDNKAWATRVAQENAALKKQSDEFKAHMEAEMKKLRDEMAASKKANPAEDDTPQDVKDYLESDPVLRKAIQHEAQRLLAQRFGNIDLESLSKITSMDFNSFVPGAVSSRIEEINANITQMNFERAVVAGVRLDDGGYMKGHPDAYQVMASQDFKSWYEKESAINPALGAISTPVEAIGVLDRFKAHVAAASAAAANKTAQAEAMKTMMSGAVEKGNNSSSSRGSNDKDLTAEEAFEQGIK
jgi:hypothetical protein